MHIASIVKLDRFAENVCNIVNISARKNECQIIAKHYDGIISWGHTSTSYSKHRHN